jgi:phosphatidylglycerophosphatase A
MRKSPEIGEWEKCGGGPDMAHGSMMIPRRSAKDRALIFVGAMGPLGFLPASGTVTVAVIGLPLFWATRGISLAVFLAALAAFTLAAVWIHQRGDKALEDKDSRILVWDEVAGFMVAVVGVPFSWKIAVLAFLLERGLDIVKFWPARWVEDKWPGGWGVVGDDVVAGLYTLGLLQLLVRIAPGILV